jgi:2-polyprenyl-6-hydroxyphenyl methylase/3-demethylubiquinone-9 3-methyltransferase
VSDKLRDVDSHFAFGRNWASFAALVDDAAIEEAQRGLLRLIPREQLHGRSFLDIGCGSGLHALAAARLGVARILAVDIDRDSVATTRALLSGRRLGIPWQAEEVSVFDLHAGRQGTFDIVYSWGVLHHTGDMWAAVASASALVAPDGLFAFALYRTTSMDAFWKLEKRLYSRAPRFAQRLARGCFIAAYRLAHARTGQGSFRDFVAGYRSARGMDFHHDVHDWLGGYPYETALAPEVETRMAALGFAAERVFAQPMTRGLLGSGCDEYVYRRRRPDPGT